MPQFSQCLGFCLGRSPCETGSEIPSRVVREIRRRHQGRSLAEDEGREKSEKKPLVFSTVVGMETSQNTVKSGVRILGGDQGVCWRCGGADRDEFLKLRSTVLL